MPFLDIAITQLSFRNYLVYSTHPFVNGNVPSRFSFHNDERLAFFWKSFQNPRNSTVYPSHSRRSYGKFRVNAVATVEPKARVEKAHEILQVCDDSVPSSVVNSSREDSEEVDEREKLRRMRISKANKGNKPWNKGRKHSPETVQRIRERTKLAMQNPKIKMKLANLGHAQSNETRKKIGVAVQMGWKKRRQKLMLQETCLFEWQNLVAEAARKGFEGEDELQWDSYKILDEQLQREWLESIELRKMRSRPQGSKRAPKSLEQRRKIAEAIAAKWADPEYRQRVYSGLTKYRGTQVGVERKSRRRPSGEGQVVQRLPKKKENGSEKSMQSVTRMRAQRPVLKKSNVPVYKDPLVKSKLEMIKSIRARRSPSETKKLEALRQAKLLIAEAEKAAKALESAATRSPIAQDSLIEARKLVAEAVQSIESIENRHVSTEEEHQTRALHKEVNGTWVLEPILPQKNPEFDFLNPRLIDSIDSLRDRDRTSHGVYELDKLDINSMIAESEMREILSQNEPSESVKLNGSLPPNGVKLSSTKLERSHSKGVTKKWVRGRFVEVVGGE